MFIYHRREELKCVNLTIFEECIPRKILARGKQYFEENHILGMVEVSPQHFVAEIMGSNHYTIQINLNGEGEIVHSACDCPYDWGDYCKHQVAAFYALREKIGTLSAPEKNKKVKNTKKKEDIETILSRLSKAELLSLAVQLVKGNPEIAKRIEYMYATTEDEVASSKELINSYIRQYKRSGFIAWRDVDHALEGANIVLEKARQKAVEGHAEEAVLLCIAILSVVVRMLQYSDDSGGSVGSVINESIKITQEAVRQNIESMDAKQKNHLYTVVMKEAMHKRYDGWGEWSNDLLRVCIPFCADAGIRKKFEKQLNTRLNGLDMTSWSAKYELERIKLIQLELWEYHDGEEKALKFIYENIAYSPFREKAIIYLLENEQYTEVVSLCKEGISLNKDYAGLVLQWKKYLLQAYKGLGDIPKQRELMLDFIYRNHFQYYLELKELYLNEEWPAVQQDILHTLEKKTYPISIYVEILKEEKLNDKLLAYCHRYPSAIQELYPYLLEDYAADVNKIFKTFIEAEAAEANERKKYKKVCKIIKDYKKIGGNRNTALFIEELKQTFKNRPAFLDELGKIG